MLLAVRGCTCALRGCSRTLKTLNSPPLVGTKSMSDQRLLSCGQIEINVSQKKMSGNVKV